MKKILTIVFALHKGGTERAAQNFAEAYLKLGYDSRVLVTKDFGVRADELRDAGVQIYDYRNPDDIDTIVLWSPDVIHIHSLGITQEVVSLLINRINNQVKVVETNVFSVPSPYEQYLDYSFQLSEWCNWIYSKQPHQCKSAILSNPVNTSNFYRTDSKVISAFRNKHNIKDDEIVIGRIGQNCISKWSDLLIDVFTCLCIVRNNIKLLIVNPPDEIINQISIQPVTVQNRIVCVERILGDEALRQCYSAIDIFAHVADQGESFGLVLAEAMLCEVPVVTFSTPWGDNSQCEVVGNGIGGYVATNFNDLYAAIDKLIMDANLRMKLGKMARLRIVERYDSVNVARNVLALIGNAEYMPNKTSNTSVCKIYADVYGTYNKLVLLLLFIAPTRHVFNIIRVQILLISKYGIFYVFNKILWKKVLGRYYS